MTRNMTRNATIRPALRLRFAAMAACAVAPGAVFGDAPAESVPPDEAPARDEAIRCFGAEVPRVRCELLGLQWRLGAYAAFDAVDYGSDNPRDDDFGATDLRPIVEARSGPFSLRIEGDAVGVDTPRNLYEAWAAWEFAPFARVTAGQFRVALGSEFATHERDLSFVGYAFPAHLDGRHDVGVRIDGTVTDGLWYQATATAGSGFDLEGHRLTSSQLSLRAAAHPLRLAGVGEGDSLALLRGFHVGFGLARLGDGDDPVIVSTPLQSRIFDTPDLGGDSGSRLRLEAGWSAGPFQLGFEDASGSIDDVPLPGGGRDDIDQLTAFSWFAAWNLTGEDRGWRDGAFVPCTGPRDADGLFSFLPDGRWEIAARYSNADIDRTLFDAGIASYDVSSQETRTISAALTWEPCATFRVGLAWVKSMADDEIAAFGGTDSDTSIALRIELRF